MSKTFERALTVRGDRSRGRRPYIDFRGLLYSSRQLRDRPELIGKKIILLIDPDDISILGARLENGQKLEPLEMLRIPHRIKTFAQVRMTYEKQLPSE